MATTVREIISRAYTLLNNASEEELDLMVVLEQYSVTVSEMQHERILGNVNPEIRKASIAFADESGIANDVLSDFTEDVVFARFNGQVIQLTTANTLDLFKQTGQQAVAFYKDSTSGTVVPKIELAQKIAGTLEIWYEPRVPFGETEESNIELEDIFKYLLSTRLAYNCCKYLMFKDPLKEANKVVLAQGLREQSEYAKDLYKTKVNRIEVGNRPYARIPYSAY